MACLVQQDEAQGKPSPSGLLTPLHLSPALPNSCCCPLILFPPLPKPDFTFCLFLSHLEFLWRPQHRAQDNEMLMSGMHSADNCTPQDLQMLVLRTFRCYKRTKRESYTIYCISVNVGGSIECRSCARENRDEAVPQTPQNRGVHVVHLRKAVLEKKKLAEFFKR